MFHSSPDQAKIVALCNGKRARAYAENQLKRYVSLNVLLKLLLTCIHNGGSEGVWSGRDKHYDTTDGQCWRTVKQTCCLLDDNKQSKQHFLSVEGRPPVNIWVITHHSAWHQLICNTKRKNCTLGRRPKLCGGYGRSRSLAETWLAETETRKKNWLLAQFRRRNRSCNRYSVGLYLRGRGCQKLEHYRRTDRQTDAQRDATENITRRHSLVVRRTTVS